jgi:hypothetical protein
MNRWQPPIPALEYLRIFAEGPPLSEADLAAAYVVKEYRTAHNGVTHLIFRQRFQGVDIVNAEWVGSRCAIDRSSAARTSHHAALPG